MAFVILDGEGTYRVGTWTFRPGATEVPDDDPVLEYLSESGPDFLHIQDTRDPIKKPIILPPVKHHDPYTRFKGRDGKWYFLTPSGKQSKAYLDRQEADAAIAAEKNKIPLAEDYAQRSKTQAGVATLEDVLPSKPVPCREPTCDRTFRNRQAEENHAHIMHPDRV